MSSPALPVVTPERAPHRTNALVDAWRSASTRLSSPRRSPLPVRRQVVLGLGSLSLLFTALVALRISGSSMGVLYSQFFGGADPRLLVGRPWPIRSDEWLVSTPLTVSQVDQGLPRFNGVLPGGFDASIVWDLPTRDWSVLLRPHMWGFFVLPLDYAFAFRWWLPFFVMTAAVFTLVCLLWRRPFAALAVAGAFAVSPFFQWWFGAGSFWPPAAAATACAAMVVLLRSRRRWERWAAAGLTGYVVAVAAVSLYPPYLIPCIYPAAAFCIGWFATRSSFAGSWRQRWGRLVPLGVAAAAAGLAVVAFLTTHHAAVDAVNATVYPGARRVPTGQSAGFPWTAMYAGVFASALHGDIRGFAPNASEGSSFVLLGLYLLASAAWLVWSRWRRLREVDWAIVATVGSLVLLLAFVYVPGWDPVAHVLLLDRVNMPRIVIGFGTVSILLLALVVGRLREGGGLTIPWWTTAGAVVLVVADHLAVWHRVRAAAPAVLANALAWVPMLVLLAFALAMFSRGRATVPAVLVALVGLVVAGWVNPLYQGVLDLRSTSVGQAIEKAEADEPGAWVAVGPLGATAVLRETGVEAYSGVQGWPTQEMWAELDPDGSDRTIWDRYAHVNWTADPTAPPLTLVQADVVQVRLDSCDPFAQQHLAHVLSQQPLDQPCLAARQTVAQGPVTYYLYDVVPTR